MTSIFTQRAIMEMGTTQVVENNCATAPTEYATVSSGACIVNGNSLYAQNVGACKVTATNGDCDTPTLSVMITEDGKPNIFSAEELYNINVLEVSAFLVIISAVAIFVNLKKI